MPFLEKQLIVKRSTLKGAGKGLFTLKDIPKGKKIVEYKGKISKWKEVDAMNGMNGYIYYVNRDHVIDASLALAWRNAGRLATSEARPSFRIRPAKGNSMR